MPSPRRNFRCPVDEDCARKIISDIYDIIANCEDIADESSDLVVRGSIIIRYKDKQGRNVRKELPIPKNIRDKLIKGQPVSPKEIQDLIDKAFGQIPRSGTGGSVSFDIICEDRPNRPGFAPPKNIGGGVSRPAHDFDPSIEFSDHTAPFF